MLVEVMILKCCSRAVLYKSGSQCIITSIQVRFW